MSVALIETLFDEIAACSDCPPGYTRPSYSQEEQCAHDVMARHAADLGLETRVDPGGNLYVTLPGKNRDLPKIVFGSHLDTVAQGGLYDGAAGVVAGFAALARLREQAIVPGCDVTVMAIRAEESEWFPASYIGSRAALGLLGADELRTLKRTDTGQSLYHHMEALGLEPSAIDHGRAYLGPHNVGAYVEVHIEQAAALESAGQAIGLVSGIRGSFRYRKARCFGAYAHSGATPRELRKDTVLAFADLMMQLEAEWLRRLGDEQDLVATTGMVSTNLQEHGFSKIAGEIGFSVDVRSRSKQTLAQVDQWLVERCAAIGKERSVSFDLGDRTGSEPALMDSALLDQLSKAADAAGIDYMPMVSGAGHDAAAMAKAGVPSAMIFVRNANGSHNPDEAMEIADLDAAVDVLTAYAGGTAGR